MSSNDDVARLLLAAFDEDSREARAPLVEWLRRRLPELDAAPGVFGRLALELHPQPATAAELLSSISGGFLAEVQDTVLSACVVDEKGNSLLGGLTTIKLNPRPPGILDSEGRVRFRLYHHHCHMHEGVNVAIDPAPLIEGDLEAARAAIREGEAKIARECRSGQRRWRLRRSARDPRDGEVVDITVRDVMTGERFDVADVSAERWSYGSGPIEEIEPRVALEALCCGSHMLLKSLHRRDLWRRVELDEEWLARPFGDDASS